MKYFFVAATVFLLSAGQVLFKMASGSIDFRPQRLVLSLVNGKLFLALLVYMLATFMWLVALKMMPLRQAYPFAAGAFFVVPVLSFFWLHENLGWNTFVGATVIAIGVIISVWK